jgi:hypothetical protein
VRRNTLLLVVFIVVSAILTHDILMAGSAHAASRAGEHTRVHTAVHRDAIASYTSGMANSGVAGSADQVAGTRHSTGCTVVRQAVPPRDDGVGLIAGQPPSESAPPTIVASFVPTALILPGQPPGTRRALLQVYRI